MRIGMAELADVPESTGSPRPYYLALGGLAAVALAITAGAWHARRRRPRHRV